MYKTSTSDQKIIKQATDAFYEIGVKKVITKIVYNSGETAYLCDDETYLNTLTGIMLLTNEIVIDDVFDETNYVSGEYIKHTDDPFYGQISVECEQRKLGLKSYYSFYRKTSQFSFIIQGLCLEDEDSITRDGINEFIDATEKYLMTLEEVVTLNYDAHHRFDFFKFNGYRRYVLGNYSKLAQVRFDKDQQEIIPLLHKSLKELTALTGLSTAIVRKRVNSIKILLNIYRIEELRLIITAYQKQYITDFVCQEHSKNNGVLLNCA